MRLAGGWEEKSAIVGRNRAERCGGYNLHTSPGGWEGSLDTNGRTPFWLKAAFQFPPPAHSLETGCVAPLSSYDLSTSCLGDSPKRPRLPGREASSPRVRAFVW